MDHFHSRHSLTPTTCLRVNAIRLRIGVLVGLLATATACGSSPSGPSGSSSLTVTVTDETTTQLILDPLFGISLHLTGPVTVTQPLANGAASFSGLPPGTYHLTAEIEFGYVQLDILSVYVEGTTRFGMKLTPIDDLVVKEVFVDGQGNIPKNGTIMVPADGVNVRYRGKYRSSRSPWPAQNQFFLDTRADPPNYYVTQRSSVSAPLNATDWEYLGNGFKPCTRDISGSTICPSSVKVNELLLSMYTPRPGFAIAGRDQAWTITFVRGPGCCCVWGGTLCLGGTHGRV